MRGSWRPPLRCRHHRPLVSSLLESAAGPATHSRSLQQSQLYVIMNAEPELLERGPFAGGNPLSSLQLSNASIPNTANSEDAFSIVLATPITS